MAGILTLTVSPVLDRYTSVERVVPDHKLRCEAPQEVAGGGGVNVARVAHALGEDALAIWTCGGPTGHALARLLERERVPHQAVGVGGETRWSLIVHDRSTDQQYRFGIPGAPLAPEEADRLVAAVAAARPAPGFLVLSGSLPPGSPVDLYARLARAAPGGTRVVLDTSGDALREGLHGPLFLVKPNLRELALLAGRRLTDDAAIEQAAREIVDAGRAAAVLVSLGAAGALLVTTDLSIPVRSPTVPVVSRVGAGDSMVAGTVVGLARGLPLPEAARYGVAAGAAAVANPGPGLAGREATERLFRHMQAGQPAR